ncbi:MULTISPECIES: NfeD family protein [unclassified Coleofasciculus]|uniref:NfeD family protein n=1 Tax=unclassified Coleofasciculus TaxID=2692782 RepID=UPI001881851C|nr:MULTISPECIES: NfeD family protein [unclassified Coleofasciculus]MBE9125303.1 NfeD family protein [Coleofasciculus sp. LEGE 07081]MBE9147084.1 NfeD family protein [Coleofasciculus sp. LEGE 07092]
MSLSPSILWLLAGSILCLMELFLPTAFVEFTMGISALVVALVALIVPQFSLQVALWLLFSTILLVVSRRVLPPARVSKTLDAMEGRTLTEISAEQTGRVLYEGNSWQARCEDGQNAIAPNQKVYVVRRQGNTLVVVSQDLLQF